MKIYSFLLIVYLLFHTSPVFCQSSLEAEKPELIKRLEYEKQQAVSAEESKVVAWFAAIGLLLAAGILFKRIKDIQKHQKILDEKNCLLENVNAQLSQKNKDITDSIAYAKKIQDALLPSMSYAKNILPEHFILFKPKDIVSGDFYWIEEWKHQVFIAAVDCTGHGVPGAFMSILGSDLLHEIIKDHGITKPAAILNAMDKGLAKILHQHTASNEVKDGMDIAFCAIDKRNNLLEYAGAFNPLWLIRDNTLQEFTADKQPIGVFIDDQPKLFTNHEIKLLPGDLIYIFSDGYADQFGGQHGKKFRYKQLEEIVLANCSKPLYVQKDILEIKFDEWKGDLEQVDDMLVIGVRIP